MHQGGDQMGLQGGEIRIGVYICHCGSNIAGTVDVERVSDFASRLENVVVARHYTYMCSDPGQALIAQDIQEKKLNRVVVASCSPLMHENTFRQACAKAGLNPYLFQMTNIREHCSWVTPDRGPATEKAVALVSAAVNRVTWQYPLNMRKAEVKQSALVVGGGIAGIEAALRLADSGKKVYLVERQPTIGGHMARLYKTFPTLDCAA
jgi:heterodisulfide reductase subunit A2